MDAASRSEVFEERTATNVPASLPAAVPVSVATTWQSPARGSGQAAERGPTPTDTAADPPAISRSTTTPPLGECTPECISRHRITHYPGGGPRPELAVERDRLLDHLEDQVANYSAHEDMATWRLLTAVRAFDEAGGWGNRECASAAHWLAYRTNIGMVAAREKVRVARALGQFALMDQAMREGKLSYAKARAISRIMTPENESKLLEFARHSTGYQLEKIVRAMRRVLRAEQGGPPDEDARWLRRHSCDDGFSLITIRLPDDEAGGMLAAADELLKQMREATRRARHEKPCSIDSTPCVGQGRLGAECSSAPSLAPHVDARLAADCQATPAAQSETDCGASAIALPLAACTPGASPSESAEIPQRCSTAPGARCRPEPGEDRPDYRLDSTPRLNRVDAMVRMAELIRTGNTSGPGTGVELVVLTPRDTLEGYATEPALLPDGTPIAPATVRRLACDAAIVEAGLDAEGNVIDVGRKTRVIPRALRTALQLRDIQCRFPGCTHQSWVDGHHIQPWAEGGETRLANLVLLCRMHHKAVHEGGYTVSVEGHELRFHDPRGRLVPNVCRVLDPCPAASFDRWLEQSGAADRRTPLPDWDGHRIDWPLTIEALWDATFPRKPAGASATQPARATPEVAS